MEHFINILIIDDDPVNQRGLKEILVGGGNNILIAEDLEKAHKLLASRDIGILLLNVDSYLFVDMDIFQSLKNESSLKNVYKIVLTKHPSVGAKLVKGLNEGAIDFITIPFNPNLVKAKIDVYKSLYYKDQRIGQLLGNIFPEKVLEDLNTKGKYSPKRVNNGVVMFTDFVNFSQKARSLNPLKLLKKLEYYFTKFDEITERYKLEKIKTIGDSYMALAGVTEDTKEPEIRACLAALEIRDFMLNERSLAKALKRDFWEIRIGIHAGPLVAGIIGSRKYNFDVWGDTVNIASRAEQSSEPDRILITNSIRAKVESYFTLSDFGNVEIKKRGGSKEMYFLEQLKVEHCLYDEGKIASKQLREKCDLPGVDFHHMQKSIWNRLKSSLPDELVYHDISHTFNVEKAAIRLAKLESLSEHDLMLLRTAVYFHDAGFLVSYHENEIFARRMVENMLPSFGYSNEEIKIVSLIVGSTKRGVKPNNLLEEIMCDADHDYLGRADYYNVSKKLRVEMENYGVFMSDLEWLEYQIHYLDIDHRFFTETAKNIRNNGKETRIQELKAARDSLLKLESN